MNSTDILTALNLNQYLTDGDLAVYSPIDGERIGAVHTSNFEQIDTAIEQSRQAYLQWRTVPAPQRGELIRVFGNILRAHKKTLGALVTLECGKIYQEGLGEVQEMIDICDFAVGLSRQLYGLTIASERAGHTMSEYWHPMGPVAVISAFNFPVAVWCWNAALAIVCGNSVIWKPSEKTPLTALACQHLLQQAMAESTAIPEDLSQLLIGAADVGQQLVNDHRLPVISATGSTAMGRKVGPAVAARFGRSILELGGNNAIIVTASADLKLAVRAIVFGAVGTAGQRCTSTRRLFVHDTIYPQLLNALQQAYASLPIENPLQSTSLIGPLIDRQAYETMQAALASAEQSGATIYGGERVLAGEFPNGFYVKPALAEMPVGARSIQTETFAPILYLHRYQQLAQAIECHNDVPQGLSSAIFTTDLRESEWFRSAVGSDCGMVNINIGTSGAEIGGAFGGEKCTGGGRESGSDAWKGYMRRVTSTLNYSNNLPLAQGVAFDI